MGLLDLFRRKRRSIEDLVFGTLTYDAPWWTGTVRFPPGGDEVAVNIESGDDGPSGAQRDRFRELERRYGDLLPSIGDALWDLYRPVRLELERDGEAQPGPSGAREMAARTEPFAVDVRRDGAIELGYAFTADVGWDDAMFTIELEEWTPRPLHLDD